MVRRVFVGYLILVLVLTAGCGVLPSPTLAPATPTLVVSAPPATATAVPPTATVVPPTATAVPPTATPVPPTATAVPPTPTATAAQLDKLAAELTSLVKPLLPKPAGTPVPGGMAASVLHLKTNLGNQWIAYSSGMRQHDPLVNHWIALYTYSAAGWQQVSKIDVPGPDYIMPNAVKQVQVDPERIWLQIDGGAGAHSGVLSLVSFDGKALKLEIEHLSPSPGGSRVADLNGDKLDDVILDDTDYYVFCYACGVRYYGYQVLSWDGARLAEVKLTPLPATAAADVRTPVNKAVSLAQAGLWKDAQATMAALTARDATTVWNAALIKLHAEPFARQAAEGPYPLLDHLFYGDYAAALNVVRAYPPQTLFSATAPLLTVDIAKGWEKSIVQWITTTTTAAIGLQPDLAGAYFLRGWAGNLAKPGSAAALADIDRAVQLSPNDLLFTQSAAYLRTLK